MNLKEIAMFEAFKRNALVFVCCMLGMGASMAADSASTLTTQAGTMDRLSETQDASTATAKFARDFSMFSGSSENAQALIAGLRNGTPIVLDGATITPPTQPMGYGNTYIALSLAKAQLARYGITEPTPQQLEAALTGGTITTTSLSATGTVVTKTVSLQGILTQRAAGQGWGQIAKANGFKLGPVVSAMKTANRPMAALREPGGKQDYIDADAKHASTEIGRHVKTSSSQSITTALDGGGVVYGKSHAKAGVGTRGEQGRVAGGTARSVSPVKVASTVGGPAVHGNAGNAAGQIHGPK
jgi:hypothetical protein